MQNKTIHKLVSIMLSMVMSVCAMPVSYAAVPEQAMPELTKLYTEKTSLTNTYWDVFAAKAVLGSQFDSKNYTLYDILQHKQDQKWQATDYAAAILMLMAAGENPYRYQGHNYVQELLDYYQENRFWGAFANPVWAGIALEAAGADGYDSASYLPYAKAQLGNLSNGCDIPGWSLILLSNHLEDEDVQQAVSAFKQTIRTYQIQDGENKALIDAGGMSGSMMSISTACAVSGLTAVGEDITQEPWTVDGTSMADTLYTYSVKGKTAVNPQIAVAIADAEQGESFFNRLRLTADQFTHLIYDAQNLNLEEYTSDSVNIFQEALAVAVKTAKDTEKMERRAFGESYFSLLAAQKGLIPKDTVSIAVYGADSVLLEPKAYIYSGDITADIKNALERQKIPYTADDEGFLSIQDITRTETEDFILFVNGIKGGIVKAGDSVVLKFTGTQNTKLDKVLADDDARLLTLDDDLTHVTEDIRLPVKGIFGSAIAWESSNDAVISTEGVVKRPENKTAEIVLTAHIRQNEEEAVREFTAVVPKKSSSSTTSKEYVTFKLIGDTVHQTADRHEGYDVWIGKTKAELEGSDTVYTVFARILKENGLSFVEGTKSYITKIQSPDGYWLEEFDNGPNSGWIYTVNGDRPEIAVRDYILEDGDEIVFCYIDDYIQESSGGHSVKPKASPTPTPSAVPVSTPVPTFEPTPSPVPSATPVAKEINFSDIDHSWAKASILSLAKKGILQGKTETMFYPEDAVTRAEFVSVLYRLTENGAMTGENPFQDVLADDWYYSAVMWAYAENIIQGHGGNFCPNEQITRQDMALILFRYLDISPSKEKQELFEDDRQIAAYARDAVYTMRSIGLLNGREDGTFDPSAYASRAELAGMLDHLLREEQKLFSFLYANVFDYTWG